MSEEEIYEMIHQEMSNHYFDLHKYGRKLELRAQLAGQAMQGILSISTIHADNEGDWPDAPRTARLAVSYADALIAELAE